MGKALMRLADLLYGRVMRPLFFAQKPDSAHTAMIHTLACLDALPFITRLLGAIIRPDKQLIVGGVSLPSPVMVAAGLVKGPGFDNENSAVEASNRINIVPGWGSVPLLCGAVEFGSYTRYPRLGNSGQLMWRDTATRSTQNRVGLRNPGALAASLFLSKRQVPGVFGISIATTPGESDSTVQASHVSEAIRFFIEVGVRPGWFTVNLSCPNTEDDPQAAQTGELADAVCQASVLAADGVPVWVKIGPDLSSSQHEALMEPFEAAGIRAVVATNTLAALIKGTNMTAGLGGGQLYESALATVLQLDALRTNRGYQFDIVGCGGVMDGNHLRAYTDAGAAAVQIWSALVYRGPFAPTHIAQEFAAL